MKIKTITSQQAKDWFDNNEAILLDVREKFEYNSIKVRDSYSLPLGEVCIDKIPITESKKIIIYCQKGMRGDQACRKLISENDNLEIYNIEGGIDGWIEAGFAVEHSNKKTISLQRQLFIFIGIFLLVISLLAYLKHINFIFLIMFIGLGLLNAGITGWCGMAKLIAKAPWNK